MAPTLLRVVGTPSGVSIGSIWHHGSMFGYAWKMVRATGYVFIFSVSVLLVLLVASFIGAMVGVFAGSSVELLVALIPDWWIIAQQLPESGSNAADLAQFRDGQASAFTTTGQIAGVVAAFRIASRNGTFEDAGARLRSIMVGDQ